MKLDWDLVREALTDVESIPASKRRDTVIEAGFEDDSPEAEKARHIILLYRSGFVSGEAANNLNGEGLLLPELTWEGHQLLATLRSKDVWERIKSLAKDKGVTLSFELVKIGGKMVLEQILKGGSSSGSISA